MSISATQRNYRCHNQCIRLATTMKAGIYGHFANCIMRLWAAAGKCRRRASPGRNLQLHAMPTPNGGRFCGRRFFPKQPDFSDRGCAQSVQPFVRCWAQGGISFLHGMWLDRFLVSRSDARAYRYFGWLFYRPDLPTPEGCDLGGAQAKLG